MVGYNIKAINNNISTINSNERIKRMKSFENVMNTNYLIEKQVGYSDIASLICLYLFYPKRNYSQSPQQGDSLSISIFSQ